MIRLVFVAFVLFAASSSHAAPVGYATATGYYKKDTRPTLYQPLNLLDSREATSWCSSTSDALSDELSFGFKDVVEVDEVRVYTGNGQTKEVFELFNRVK